MLGGPTAAAALPNTYRYLRPPTRTVNGTSGSSRGWMTSVVGVNKPTACSIRLAMTELKKVSSTRCAEAVGAPSRKAAMTRVAAQRIGRVEQRGDARVNRLRATGRERATPQALRRPALRGAVVLSRVPALVVPRPTRSPGR